MDPQIKQRKIKEIILDCSLTNPDMDWGVDELSAFERDRTGIKATGYHFVVKKDGTIENGRPLYKPGVFCSGRNKHSIGICYIGGIDRQGNFSDTRTDLQKFALVRLISKLLVMYGCSVESIETYCPSKKLGIDVQKEYSTLGY
jgi:hypothetical protein